MKSSKTLILAALVAGGLFVGSTALQAQNAATNTPPAAGAPHIKKVGANIDQIAATLKLDDATKAKFKTILEDQQKKMSELRADTTLSPQDRKTKVQAIRAGTDTQLKAVLTAEQFDQWQKMSQPHVRHPASPAANPPQN